MSKKKKAKLKGKKLPSGLLREKIKKLFIQNDRKRYNAKQIIRKLKIENSRDAVQDALLKLAGQDIIHSIGDDKFKLTRSGKYSSVENGQTLEGIVDMTRSGSAYIVVENQDDDIHVAAKFIHNALNGDKVRIKTWKSRGRYKPEGEVLEVIERANTYFIGTFSQSRKFGYVMPDKLNMPVDILVYPEDQNNATDGDKVVVKVTQWHGKGKKSPNGEITTVLGKSGSSDIEMKSILINNGFNLDFPPEVLKEAEAFSEQLDEEEIIRRKDLRSISTFTIDPVDAKDFDDALSIEYLEDGHTRVGVHIADVTHYIRQGSALDKEAYSRSTSVYLVDRVLPMLPERLSNNLCSLRPNEDKYTFSAIFTFNGKHQLVDRWFGKTVIHSNRRFAYEEAQKTLETREGDMAKEISDLAVIARNLRKDRFKKGSIAFDSDEVRFKLDENSVPISIYVKEKIETNSLIEDFMLLANREVALFVNKQGKPEIPFVYRIHDLPNPDKVAELSLFALEFGVRLKIDTPEQIAKSFNDLAKRAQNEEVLKILQPIAIRTMAKAAYSTENIGHYGLGFDFYAHFTSPIRRYSDVLAHRILYRILSKGNYRMDKEKLEEQCKHISIMERKANDAERESIKYKQVEFMEKHLGETFYGIITGIIDRGIFVELMETRCEGMISFDTFAEAFEIKESRLKATGLRTGTIYKVGDQIKVTITDVDLQKRQITMVLSTL